MAVIPALVTREDTGQESCIVVGKVKKRLAGIRNAAESDHLSEIASGLMHDSK
jgi:hypothetical protein